MRNDSITITQPTGSRKRIVWEAPSAADRSWLYVNGRLVQGEMQRDTAERTAEYGSTTFRADAVEVHDADEGAIILPIYEESTTRPIIHWDAVDDSDLARYRIYHKYGEDGDEALIYDEPEQGIQRYEIRCPVRLTEGWHFFRVEAVDEYGNESTVDAWPYRVFDLPDAPENITADIDGGLLTITIEP